MELKEVVISPSLSKDGRPLISVTYKGVSLSVSKPLVVSIDPAELAGLLNIFNEDAFLDAFLKERERRLSLLNHQKQEGEGL